MFEVRLRPPTLMCATVAHSDDLYVTVLKHAGVMYARLGPERIGLTAYSMHCQVLGIQSAPRLSSPGEHGPRVCRVGVSYRARSFSGTTLGHLAGLMALGLLIYLVRPH